MEEDVCRFHQGEGITVPDLCDAYQTQRIHIPQGTLKIHTLMKSTKAFQDTIERYLEKMAQGDHLFADKLNNPNKSIEGCVNFILSEVQKSEINGFTDEEVYSMAVHYYVEEGITEHGPIQCQVVVNHQVELTPEEIIERKDYAELCRFKMNIIRKKTSRRVSSKSYDIC